jgi:hypothetical protein
MRVEAPGQDVWPTAFAPLFNRLAWRSIANPWLCAGGRTSDRHYFPSTASLVSSMALSIFSPAFSAGPFSGHALVATATANSAATMMRLRMIFTLPL